MAHDLYKLFVSAVFQSLTKNQRDIFQNQFSSVQLSKINHNDFFMQTKTALDTELLLIDIIKNDALKHDAFQLYCFRTNAWQLLSNAQEIIDVGQCILLYKNNGRYYYHATFTKETTLKNKIISLILSYHSSLVIIGITLLMANYNIESRLEEISSICQQINILSVNNFKKALYQILDELGMIDVIDFMIQTECIFPIIDPKISRFEPRIKANKLLHEMIERGDKDAIEAFLKENPNFRYYRNGTVSACASVLGKKDYEMYTFLYQRGLTVDNREVWLLNKEDFHNYFRNNILPHEEYLNRQMKVLVGATTTINKLNTDWSVEEIYQQLSKIPNFERILNVLCKVQPITIIFDYDQENISKICPYATMHMRGLFDPVLNRVFLSAGRRNEQMLGTSAHELTHFAMHLIYKNEAKPYRIDDQVRKEKFDKIVIGIKKKLSDGFINEDIIKLVFRYPKANWHSELIVRVNHILGFYGADQGSVIMKQQAPELLEFYNNEILPDIDQYVYSHFNRNDNLVLSSFHKKIETCDKYFDKFDQIIDDTKNFVIITECVELTCLRLFQCVINLANIDTTYMCDSKTFFDNQQQIKHYLQKYQLLIVADTSEKSTGAAEWNEIVEYIRNIRKRYILILGRDKQSWSFNDANIFFDIVKFSDFTKQSQEQIFNEFQINFYGRNIQLKHLLGLDQVDSELLNLLLPSDLLNNFIFKESAPAISTEYESSSLYIDRRFRMYGYSIKKLYEILVDDETTRYYISENTGDESDRGNFNLTLQNGTVVTFPGNNLTPVANLKMFLEFVLISYTDLVTIDKRNFALDDQKVLIFTQANASYCLMILGLNHVISFPNFCATDLTTFYVNNYRNFSIHWMHRLLTLDLIGHRKFQSSNTQQHVFTYSQLYAEGKLYEMLKHQKIILLAAMAGMGKSTSIKNMSKCLLEQENPIWAPVIILKNITTALLTLQSDNSDPDYYVNFLIGLLQFKTKFEQDMFKFCCLKRPGNVYLFLDGADEISPNCTDQLIQLIHGLAQTNIKHIIVSVRLNLKSVFEERLNTFAIKFEPLNRAEQIKCLKNIWQRNQQVANVDAIAVQILDLYDRIDGFFGNPLQISMLAKICEANLDAFSKDLTQIEHFFTTLTLIKIYEKFIEQKLRIDIEDKKGWNLNNPPSAMMIDLYRNITKQQLTHAAIITRLSPDEINQLLSPNEIEANQKFIDEIKRGKTYEGIIDGLNLDQLNFVHDTYADYFLARFLINKSTWNEPTENLFFERILVEAQFQMVRIFINSYNEKNLEILSVPPKFYRPLASESSHNAVSQNVHEGNLKIVKNLLALGFHLPNFSLLTKISYRKMKPRDEYRQTVELVLAHCTDPRDSLSDCLDELQKAYDTNDIDTIKLIFQCKPIEFDSSYDINKHKISLDQEQLNVLQELWVQAEATINENDMVLFEVCLKMLNIVHGTDESSGSRPQLVTAGIVGVPRVSEFGDQVMRLL